MKHSHSIGIFFLFVLLAVAVTPMSAAEASYFNDVKPIIQRSCSGCHMPSNQMGGLLLTEYAGILKGGAKGPSIQAGEPENSPLVGHLTGDLQPQMPMGMDPLAESEIEVIREWVASGAKDDTPDSEKGGPQAPEKPPVYHLPPPLSAVAYSPDGSLIAVGGFQEILIHKADGSEIVARLLGKSERINSVAFTPDGKKIVAVGGAAAQFGEVQVWDLESKKQQHSIMETNDTLFGGSISPDSKVVVFGGADKSLYGYSLESGEQLFKAGHHEDWVLATTYGIDGKRVVSVGRDRAAKLASATDGAFIENVNALRKMLYAVARHPRRDYVAIGGEDRIPLYYMMDRPRALKIADDSTLVREFEEQKGEIYALAFSPDGTRLAIGGMSDEVPIYETETGKKIATCRLEREGIFALQFHPDGSRLMAGGFDGQLRFFDPASGKQLSEFVPVPVEEQMAAR